MAYEHQKSGNRKLRFKDREIVATRKLGPWQMAVAGHAQGPSAPPKSGWRKYEIGTHWGDGVPDYTVWFRTRFQVSKEMLDPKTMVELSLFPGREALAYLNGTPAQGLSENHRVIRLTDRNHLRKPVDFLIEAYTEAVRFPPARYYGKFEYAEIRQIDRTVYDFSWDLRVALETAKELDPESASFQRLIDLLAEAMKALNPMPPGQEELRQVVAKASRRFQAGLRSLPSEPNQGRLLLAGHSHIDTAWLWPLVETRRKCARTFSTALKLMESNPEFRFSQGQPQLYRFTKESYPEVYAKIKKRVKEGRWDPAGAAWVEMDPNLSGAEAIVRQFLYGNLFFEEEFGIRNNVCWLPDAFGYNWNLPQIVKKCGLDAFVTTKMHWSQITKLPYTTFLWEGADGTRVLAMIPPLNYDAPPVPKNCRLQWNLIRQKDVLDEMLLTFGWGDGGGGPTQHMIENGRRLANMIGVPKCRFGSITGYLNEQLDNLDFSRLPIWNDELYLERHRACQITQARTKRNNRKLELLLRELEWFSVFASRRGLKYPGREIRSLWERILTNQFHDILPGSSVQSVYEEADRNYAQVEREAKALLQKAVKAETDGIDTRGKGKPLVLFNTLGWDRHDPVAVREKTPKEPFHVADGDGSVVPHQCSHAEDGTPVLWIEPASVPSMGHTVHRILRGKASVAVASELKATDRLLENRFFRVRLDRKGTVSSIWDKRAKREVLAPGQRGNVLQLFHDHPNNDDAWDYDFNIDENRREWDDLQSVEVVEEGPVRSAIRLVRKTDKSTLIQRIVLYRCIPRIDFETEVDWWEKRTLLKAAFPVNVRSSLATYEIQFATIQRPTHRSTPFDRARFEVAHHRWADLSEGNYGVTVANDCKYGFDTHEKVMRLSLLRSPIAPDPHADEGKHEFVYSLLPHAGDWREAESVRRGVELNVPIRAALASNHTGGQPSTLSCLTCDAPNVIIETLKKEERGKSLILRLYESQGCRGPAAVEFGFPVRSVRECNLVEEGDAEVGFSRDRLKLDFSPYEIRTFKLEVE